VSSSSEFIARSRLAAPAAEVFAWHERPGAFERLAPPWAPPKVLRRTGTIRDGDRVTLEISIGPVPIEWELEHVDFRAGAQFRDRQVSGPFDAWSHLHRVTADGEQGAVLEDRVEYALPAGLLGRALGGEAVVRRLAQLFAFRHAQLAADLERHRRAPAGRPLKVAVSGASGLIGRALVAFLRTGGHEVRRLVRGDGRVHDAIPWDPEGERLDPAALEGLDAVVHLAGESIADGRWTEERKRRIRESRVVGTSLLARTLARLKAPPKVFVSASAIGAYAPEVTTPADEETPVGEGFLPEVVRAWEAAAAPAAARGIRVVHPRFGVVLAPEGGMLGRLLPLFRAGLGGPVGTGAQVLSWVALDDAIGVLHQALWDERLAGAVNVVAPRAATNAGFTAALADILGRPAVLRVPGPAVAAAFGEMGRSLVLSGRQVLPRRLEERGFAFRFRELRPALESMLGRTRTPAPRRSGRSVLLEL
jgi:hypothetical protein